MRRTVYRQLALQNRGPLPNAEQTERLPLARGFRAESAPVVAYVESVAVAIAQETYLYVRGLGVPRNIGQRLLQDTKYHGRALVFKLYALVDI
jgi:hypothetical protein